MTTFRLESDLHKHYTDYCDECETVMDVRSKDGTQVYCPNCWMPKPVPLEFLSNNARFQRIAELKTITQEP